MKKSNNLIETKAHESLKDRAIEPSAKAWDRIDAMLTIDEQVKPKRSFNLIKIAASFLLLGFIISMLFVNKDEKTIPQVVNSEIENTNYITNEDTSLPKKSSEIENIFSKKETLADANKNEIVPKSEIKNVITSNNIDDSIKIVENKSTPSQINVDAQRLLAEVEQELRDDQFKNKKSLAINTTKIKIDPTLLLDETEHEMNQSFKEKAVEKINVQFKNIKEAFVKNKE